MILPGIGVLALWIINMDMPLAGAVFCGVLVGSGANVAFFLGPLAELTSGCILGAEPPLTRAASSFSTPDWPFPPEWFLSPP